MIARLKPFHTIQLLLVSIWNHQSAQTYLRHFGFRMSCQHYFIIIIVWVMTALKFSDRAWRPVILGIYKGRGKSGPCSKQCVILIEEKHNDLRQYLPSMSHKLNLINLFYFLQWWKNNTNLRWVKLLRSRRDGEKEDWFHSQRKGVRNMGGRGKFQTKQKPLSIDF